MLTIKQIDSAKSKDKLYRLLDSNGLYLYVPVNNIHILRAEGIDKTHPGRQLSEMQALQAIPVLLSNVLHLNIDR